MKESWSYKESEGKSCRCA